MLHLSAAPDYRKPYMLARSEFAHKIISVALLVNAVSCRNIDGGEQRVIDADHLPILEHVIQPDPIAAGRVVRRLQ